MLNRQSMVICVCFFPVKCSLYSGLEKAWVLSVLLMLIFTSLFIVIFVCFWVFFYSLMVICVSYTLGSLFDFISPHFWLNGALYFSLKNFFCVKSFFLINFCLFFIDVVFFVGQKLYLYGFFPIRIRSLACYLYVEKLFHQCLILTQKALFNLILYLLKLT
jgi:hypothetical protein